MACLKLGIWIGSMTADRKVLFDNSNRGWKWNGYTIRKGNRKIKVEIEKCPKSIRSSLFHVILLLVSNRTNSFAKINLLKLILNPLLIPRDNIFFCQYQCHHYYHIQKEKLNPHGKPIRSQYLTVTEWCEREVGLVNDICWQQWQGRPDWSPKLFDHPIDFLGIKS